MDKELFRKTEGRLYRYFSSLNRIDTLNIEIEELKRQREVVRRDIRDTNVFIETDLNLAVSYGEKVQTSPDGTSHAEKEVIKQIEKLERELAFINIKILKKKSKVRGLEREIISFKPIVDTLGEEEKRFIRMKYSDKKSIEYIAVELFGGVRMSAYRKRKELIGNILEWNKII